MKKKLSQTVKQCEEILLKIFNFMSKMLPEKYQKKKCFTGFKTNINIF